MGERTKVVTSGSTALRTSTMSLKMPPSAALVHTVLKAGCRSSVLHRDCRPFSTGRPSRSIERLTVFGAGLMGAGIAQVAAHNGIKVVLTDVSEDAINNGKSIIHKSLTRVARKKHPDSDKDQKALIDKTFANLTTTTDPNAALDGSDLIIEAIVENMQVKQKLFGKLDSIASSKTIFASNTSSLSISEIASATSEERQKNFAGLHFFNPVPQMKLVEVIRTKKTSDAAFKDLLQLCERVKKSPVSCLDTPGFIVNRLLVPYMLEALRLVERGEATPEDVDTAMKLGAGMPMGPFELSDYVGLDTLKHIADGWRESRVATGEINAESVAPVGLLDEKVKSGKLGRKSGQGFFQY